MHKKDLQPILCKAAVAYSPKQYPTYKGIYVASAKKSEVESMLSLTPYVIPTSTLSMDVILKESSLASWVMRLPLLFKVTAREQRY
jgi:hypothetical protein